MDALESELSEEEAIVASSTRFLDVSLNLNKLAYLQAMEAKKALSFTSKLKAFFSVILRNIFKGANYLSEFESVVLKSEPNDCSLIAKYSTIEKVGSIYLNVINIPHPLRVHLERSTAIGEPKKKELLGKINSTPLVILIHGLGGQSSQFEQLIAILSQCADIFSLDLPGFGNSTAREKLGQSMTEYDPNLAQAAIRSLQQAPDSLFATVNLVDLLTHLIDSKRGTRKVILIGHSMGTHLCLKLINKLPSQAVEAVILLSPPKIEADLSKTKLGILSRFPQIFDIMRIWDRIGGLDSKSVARQVYSTEHFKRLRQLRWNLDVDSNIILKYINGFQACSVRELSSAASRINEATSGRRILILCGSNDKLTPKDCSLSIADKLSAYDPLVEILDNCGHSILLDKAETMSGLVYKFIESIPGLNINLGWCLQIKALSSGDKWGLKNEMKWKKLTKLSDQIINPTTGELAPLLSMKTLRESDAEHNPASFEKGNPSVTAIIDISSDLPSYNPDSFERIKYHKMPTVSKFIPDSMSIREFIVLVDEIRADESAVVDGKIAVHCHYGFNRTGFLICCYLIERLGWRTEDALLGFKTAREPGIKHPHFIDGLYVRYK